MSLQDLPLMQGALRGTDTNSLLRLYDQARDIATHSALLHERIRADKVTQRIVKELKRRKVSVAAGLNSTVP